MQKEKEQKEVEHTAYIEESICESEQVEHIEPLRVPPVMQPSEKIHVNKQLLKGLLDSDAFQ